MEKRTDYHKQNCDREAANVVKGVAKRVIVVRSPDPKIFEEAIFIVREDYGKDAGVSRAQLLSEAQRAAGLYMGSLRKRSKKQLPPVLLAAMSAILGSGAAAALVYFMM